MKFRKSRFKLLITGLITWLVFYCCPIAGAPGFNIHKKAGPAGTYTSKYRARRNKPAALDCDKINWAAWDKFIGQSATGTITNNDGSIVNVTMNSNFTFGATPGIYNYPVFGAYPSPIPNAQVPETTWSAGAGGTTTMCFSKTVTNPVLLVASLGDHVTVAQISFSLPYVVLFDGGGMKYNDNTTLTGTEGNAIIMFPGDFDCVTINSTTPENYTNITWGLRPPPFPISIAETAGSCGSATLTASGGSSYFWNDGDTPDNATNTFHKSGIYIVTVTNADGCTTSFSKTINIDPLPAPVISGDTTGCTTVTLTAGGGISYVWDGGANPNSAVNTFKNSGIYNVTVTGANGCQATKSVNVTVDSSGPPSINISAAPSDTLCSGAPVTFTPVAVNGGPSPAFQWFRNNVAVATGDTYTVAGLANNDIISCLLTSSSPCATSPTAMSNAIAMTVNEAPAIVLDQKAESAGPEGVMLDPTVSGDVKTYLWSPASGLSDPAIRNPLANPQYNTAYQLTVTSVGGCQVTAGITVDVKKADISIPNTFTPNGDGVNDTWDITNLSTYPDATVEVYSRYGARLFHSIGYSKPWDGTYNGKRLPVGTYYYIINLKYNNYKLKSGWIAVLR